MCVLVISCSTPWRTLDGDTAVLIGSKQQLTSPPKMTLPHPPRAARFLGMEYDTGKGYIRWRGEGKTPVASVNE